MSNEATKNYRFIYYLYIILYINTDRRQEQYNEDDPEEFLKTMPEHIVICDVHVSCTT